MGFFEQVHRLVGQVPRGRVVTYGQIAQALGRPHGARAVGWAMRQCPDDLPWHRVVNAQGRISLRGMYAHCDLQRALLEEEGVIFDPADRIDLRRFGWDGF
ncbi:MAG: methylated-DNA--[protein]-cysteine S-methyltransferase [Chloroflexi bacterium]|mgnify:FL=1|jgi:methylated-DNA-protein-cysteine methyltransferase-like protein|nr:methylated-DNA--[protein]-cysteine S-methyltransferase [Chloroflexota bacterium]